jgi:hypothetical protein
MNESSEVIGSMPSVPQPELRPQTSREKQMPGNLMGLVFFLWAICLLVFPVYAHTDDLGTGVFDGMGLTLIMLIVLALLATFARRSGKNRRSKTALARSGPKTPRRWQKMVNGILFGMVFLLLGVYLLTSPDLGDLSIVGLFALALGIGVIFFVISRSVFNQVLLSTKRDRLENITIEQQQQSNNLNSGVFFLFVGICALAFPPRTSINAFACGIFYGTGLILLLLALVLLAIAVPRKLQT